MPVGDNQTILKTTNGGQQLVPLLYVLLQRNLRCVGHQSQRGLCLRQHNSPGWAYHPTHVDLEDH